MNLFSRDLGIDLGSSNVLIYSAGKGIILREPAVIAVDKNNGKVLRVGSEARNMLGRTPGNVAAVHPLQNGVISDYELTSKMLTEMVGRIVKHAVIKPRMIVSVPSGITEVEERAVISAGTTDIGVVSMNGIANSASLKIAGIEFDNAIIRYVRRNYGLVIGQNAAEDAKLAIGCVIDRPEPVKTEVKGRDIKTGLARQIELTGEDMREALKRPARMICDKVLEVLEQTTPELVSDIAQNGIVLTGGGSQIWGMDKLLEQRTAISCMLADDADSCVAYGCGKSLTWINHMTEGTINIARKRLLKE